MAETEMARAASQRHLVIFARRPQLGVGKRRLARGAGALTAWRFQRLMLVRLLRRLGPDPRWTTWLAVTPDRAARDLRWLPVRGSAPVRAMPQGPGDLGRRMARPMHRLPPGPVVIVGSDIPDLGAARVAAAFDALGSCDAVLGPAADGGYWLVGLAARARKRPPFDGVRWSGAHARTDTLANLARVDASWRLLAPLSDVDEAGDLRAEHFR
jgi:rSAM/selenodomain-associated transferase 1